MKARVTLDSGVAVHVMLEGMITRVKLEFKIVPKKFVAANDEQITDMGEKTIPLKTNEEIHKCITLISASVAKPVISMQRVVRAGKHLWCWMKRIRTFEIFEMEQLPSWT